MTKLTSKQIASSEISPDQATYIGTYYELLPPKQETEASNKYHTGQNLFRTVLKTTAIENAIHLQHLDRPVESDEPDSMLTDVFAEPPVTAELALEISRIIYLRLKAIEAGRNMVGYIYPWHPLGTNSSDTE